MATDFLVVMEDMVRVELSRMINIHTRVDVVSCGNRPHQRSMFTAATYSPIHVRLAQCKHFYFELRQVKPDWLDEVTEQIQTHLDDVRKIPQLDLSRIMIRIPGMDIHYFWEHIFNVVRKVIGDVDWWVSMAERLDG